MVRMTTVVILTMLWSATMLAVIFSRPR